MEGVKEDRAFLPDPFLKADGTRVQSSGEWKEQTAYFRELAQKYMYGKWPGSPKSLDAEVLEVRTEYGGKALREKIDLCVDGRFHMAAELVHPAEAEGFPTIIQNASPGPQSCPVEKDIVVKAGYGIATFEREAIMPDYVLKPEERAQYPQLECGAIMAWGWCQSLVADYLQSRGDIGELIATGHSRNGKAALCAGIFDERFVVVAPMGSGCGGAGSARFTGTADGKRQDDARCETIGSLVAHFPHWFADSYAQFATKQEPYPIGEAVKEFPLDANILRAACAPRAVFNSEGVEDFWANGFGTQLACDSAQKVFDFLGVPQNNAFHMRPGGHSFCEHDWIALVDFCDMVLGRERKMKHDDTIMKYFEIHLEDYEGPTEGRQS